MNVVAPTWAKTKPDDPQDEHHGWVFKEPTAPAYPSPNGMGNFTSEGAIPDELYNKSTIRELYEMACDELHRYSVPILWDKQSKTIVNNESKEIAEMLS